MSAHPEPIALYLKIFAALLILTAITVVTAYIDFGILNIVITLAIAGLKTVLILLFFMHLRHSHHLVKAFTGVGFLWLGLMVAILMSDYLTRSYDHRDTEPSWIQEDARHYLVPKKLATPEHHS